MRPKSNTYSILFITAGLTMTICGIFFITHQCGFLASLACIGGVASMGAGFALYND